MTATTTTPFTYPPHHSFPPFYTLQPVLTTRHAQLLKWSSLILSYSQHHHFFKLSLSTLLSTPLFTNTTINRRLSSEDAHEVVSFMVKQNRAEWVNVKTAGDGGGNVFWVWWKSVDEWASELWEWVDNTAQRNTVLTLYELTESEATLSQDFHGMDPELLQRVLTVLVKRGKAQVFGQEDGQGVKFF